MIGPQSYAGLMGRAPSQFDAEDQFNPQAQNPIITLANGAPMANGNVPQMSMNNLDPTAAPDPASFGLLPEVAAPVEEPSNWAGALSGALHSASKIAAQPPVDIYSGLYGSSLYGSAMRKHVR